MAYSRNDTEIKKRNDTELPFRKKQKASARSLPFSFKFQMFLRFQYLKNKIKTKLEENTLYIFIS